MNGSLNYYDILGVSETATDEEIKRAYREVIKKWHPDKNSSKDATYMSQKINEAKEILLNKRKRFAFDQELKQERDASFEQYTNSNKERKKESKTTTTNSTNASSKERNNFEKENVGKWAYMYYWVRFYDVNIMRKIVGLLGVIIESLLCLFINLALSVLRLLMIIFGFLTNNLGKLALLIIFIVVGLNLLISGFYAIIDLFSTWNIWKSFEIIYFKSLESLEYVFANDKIMNFLRITISFIVFGLIDNWFIKEILTENVYSFFRYDLNSYLFRKCVGYN